MQQLVRWKWFLKCVFSSDGCGQIITIKIFFVHTLNIDFKKQKQNHHYLHSEKSTGELEARPTDATILSSPHENNKRAHATINP